MWLWATLGRKGTLRLCGLQGSTLPVYWALSSLRGLWWIPALQPCRRGQQDRPEALRDIWGARLFLRSVSLFC